MDNHHTLEKLGGNFDQVLDITLVSVPAGIIGARLYHIITTPERFFGPDGDWAEMFRIWNGGLGIWAACCSERWPHGHGAVISTIQWPCWLTPSLRACW